MPDKLTDNKVIKGLECHSRPSNSCGSNCPYLMCEEVMCTKRLSKDALDLINRLQADVENYKQVAEHQQSVTLDRGFEIKRLKKVIEEKDKELIDREKSHINLYNEMSERLETAKAEAVTEFAERLKEKAKTEFPNLQILTAKDIDNLLKELVGDT